MATTSAFSNSSCMDIVYLIVVKDAKDWKKKLTPTQYAVTCEGSTEPPFTGEYLYNHDTGMYNCVRCGNPLFESQTKFDSGTGWPSFWDAANKNGSVELKDDNSLGMQRTEDRK